VIAAVFRIWSFLEAIFLRCGKAGQDNPFGDDALVSDARFSVDAQNVESPADRDRRCTGIVKFQRLEPKELFYAGSHLHRRHGGLIHRRDRLHLCLWEALIMENFVVGSVAILLFIHLFISLIRPEKF